MTHNTVSDDLANRIADTGPISVADFMETVALAYYGRGDVFGRDGDFITAPEISQVFGELVGLWCVTAWQALGQPRHIHLVECGPGRGTLMADALRAIQNVAGIFIRSASIHLIERSTSLRQKQRELLGDYDIEWHDDLSTLPHGQVIIIGNEFLDALPITQYVKTASGWCERMVGHGPNGFEFQIASLPSADVDDTFDDAPDGSILEQSNAVANAVGDMAQLCLDRHGAALMIDYGHVYSDIGETLQAVKNHAPHPVLEHPGTADLTAHVDFALVAQSARAESAKVFGPVEQGQWLRRIGIEVRAAQLMDGKPKEVCDTIGKGVHRLIDPDAMGRLFKVIAFASPDIDMLAGFEDGV